ncbi:MAG: endonuclease V-like protein UPF0215 family [Bradymonadia bacterium]|jgi:endonuclease V-like protein UPF0215 family
MKSLADALRAHKLLRVIGFDDAPFSTDDAHVNVSGIVCAGTRFEGMLWGQAERDGADATQVLATLCTQSKFHAQVHLVLIDGLAVGGFNLIDLPALAEAVDRPCVAVTRRPPDMPAIRRALGRFADAERRLRLVERAGPIYCVEPFCFQVIGAPPDVTAQALQQLTDRGHVPEALRLAHLIGSAIQTGQSGRRA